MSDKILIIDHIHPILSEQLQALGYTVTDGGSMTDEELTAQVPECIGIVLRSRWSLNRDWFVRNGHLQFVARVGAGLEHIDLAAAKDEGVVVLSSPEGNRQAVAEQALGMLLNLLHHISKSNNEVRNGVWSRKSNQGTELQGMTVGIIGYGNTGTAFGQLLSGFGVRVLAYDKYKPAANGGVVEPAGMNEIYKHADVVSLHIPQSTETKGMVRADWLSKFERPIYFINTSRGKIVHDEDLLTALDNGGVMGAALDVLSIENEDLSIPEWADLPTASRALIEHSRVLVTPHIAGLSDQSFRKLAEVMAGKIIHLLRSA